MAKLIDTGREGLAKGVEEPFDFDAGKIVAANQNLHKKCRLCRDVTLDIEDDKNAWGAVRKE